MEREDNSAVVTNIVSSYTDGLKYARNGKCELPQSEADRKTEKENGQLKK